MIDDPMIRRNRIGLVIDPISQTRQRMPSSLMRMKGRFTNSQTLKVTAFFLGFSPVEVLSL